MALKIQNPLVGTLLQRAFGLQGRVRPELEEFIVPTVSLGDLSLSFPPDTVRHCAAQVSITGVTSQRSVGRFEVLGGCIAVIRRIQLFSATDPGDFSCQFVGNTATLSPLATTAPKGFTDGRLLAGSMGGAQTPSSVLTTGTQASSIGTVTFRARMLPVTNGSLFIYEPAGGWVVGTGQAEGIGFWQWQVSANNNNVNGSIEWDEYQLV